MSAAAVLGGFGHIYLHQLYFNRVPKSPFQPPFPRDTARPEVIFMKLCMFCTRASAWTVASKGTMLRYSTECTHGSHKVGSNKHEKLTARVFSNKGCEPLQKVNFCQNFRKWKPPKKESLLQLMSEQMFTTPLGQWKQCKQLFQIETILPEFLGYTTQLQAALF